MNPDELLLRYPGETLRWLRQQLGLTQRAFAAWLGASRDTITQWEQGAHPIPLAFRRRLMPLVARYLVTHQGAAFVRSLDEQGGMPR